MKLQFSTLRMCSCLCLCVACLFVNKWTLLWIICSVLHMYRYTGTHMHMSTVMCHTIYIICVLMFHCNRFDILFHTESAFTSFDSCYLKSHFRSLRFYFFVLHCFEGVRSLRVKKRKTLFFIIFLIKIQLKRIDRFWLYTWIGIPNCGIIFSFFQVIDVVMRFNFCDCGSICRRSISFSTE